jgi:tetratricopeptide (TPR) repeat protein
VIINRGDREAALPLLRRTVELAGEGDDNLAPRLVLAESLLLLGRSDEAAPHIESAVRQNPTDPRARFDAGLLAVARQEWAAARDHLLQCLTSPYSRQRARIQLAAVYRRLGDEAKANEFQAEADRMPADADWPDPIVTEYLQWAEKKRSVYKIAEALEAQGQFAEAIRRVGPVLDEHPDDDVGQALLGRLFAQLGNSAAAERALRRAQALAPHKIQAYYYLSLTLVQEGERREARGEKTEAQKLYAEAADQAREALKRKPDYGLAHMALGLALKHLGKRDEAVAAFEQAVRCNPEHAEIHWHTAEALAEAGRTADAIPRFEQALRLAPPGTPWRASTEARLAELKKKVKK